MEIMVMVAATVGSPFAPHDGSDGHDVAAAGSTRVTGYPVGAGRIDDTLTEDGEPTAVLLLMEEPALPGRTVRARPVALVHALRDGRPCPELVCVPAHDANFAALTGVRALRAWHADEGTLATVLHRLDPAHHWRVEECEDPPAAEEFVTEARQAYARLTGCLD